VLSYGLVEPGWLTLIHVVYLLALATVGWILAARQFTRRLNS
jgi:lipooligosaccharide transport system permease protein